MPLHLSPPPAPALRCVLAALQDVHGPTATSGPGSPHPELSLPVHTWKRLRDPRGEIRTELTGWRFPLGPAEGTSADPPQAAEALLTPEGWTFGYLSQGPYVTSTERALRQCSAQAGSYQPRLLSLPELYMLTLWLHGDVDAAPDRNGPAPNDLLVPLAPAPPGIPSHRPHRVEALLPLLTVRLLAGPLMSAPA
ncbi:hypothetical protein [Streptomyces sp. NPDC005438]|uniref:hypothetical protein n=1 Tax=Streptomyces sp. NPDC005438 TaxID=3156880 RepID=UPI0033BCB9E8